MVILIILVVLGYIVYVVSRDKNSNTQRVITNYGGMLEKYSELISYLSQGGCHIDKVKSGTVILGSKSMKWSLDVIGENIEIRMNGFMPMLGNVSHKWIYPHNFSQTRMIRDIENYINWEMSQFISAIENNPKEHLR